MANEISASVSLSVSKNNASFSVRADKSFDQAGNIVVNNVQIIGTSAELLALGDITGVPSAYVVWNLDTTNFVELALDNGMAQKFAKIPAGRAVLVLPSVAAVYAKADTSPVNCVVLAAEA